MALITANNLCLAYDKENVCSDLNFTINQGDYLCIVGENGSGKSTLIKAILGLKKASGGSLVFGEGLTSSQIGYLPQQSPLQKDFPASVYEIVLSGRLGKKILPFYTGNDKKIALDSMASLGITNLKNKCYRNLSGGQKQRVLLARALCAAGRVLLLDEPVTGLDPAATSEMYSLISHLNRDHKITIIMVSHDIKASLNYSSHILHLRNHALFFGTTDMYRKSEQMLLFGKDGENND